MAPGITSLRFSRLIITLKGGDSMGHTRTEVHAPVQGIIAIDPDEESFIQSLSLSQKKLSHIQVTTKLAD